MAATEQNSSSEDMPVQHMGTSTKSHITVRGYDLVSDLMGEVTFTDLFFLEIVGRLPEDRERILLDAVLVTLVEHGVTANALATRLTLLASPESMQGAVAAGILGAGTVFLGALEGCAKLLQGIVSADDQSAAVEAAIESAKNQGAKVPGIGHPLHKPVDPRTERLYRLADDLGFPDEHRRALDLVKDRAEEIFERSPLPVNADGAIGAVLSDMGLSWRICRGVAIVARSAGLVGHVWDEMSNPIAHSVWNLAEEGTEYRDPEPNL